MRPKDIILSFCIILLTACAVSQGERVERKRKRLRSISNAKLYKETVAHYLDYKTINFKKISISYEEEGEKQDFRGSVRILKDSIIWLSISKMGLEGMRVKLTPDSIAFIDRLHREYMITDYSYLNERFNLELNYYLVQSILTNQLPEYRIAREELPFFRNFKGKKSATHYLFYSKKRKDRQYWREHQNKKGNEGSVLEILRISPDLMRLESIDIYDTQFLGKNGQQTVSFKLKYEDYKTYNEKHLFPERITTTVQREIIEDFSTYKSTHDKMILSIEVNKLEVNPQSLSFPFNISSKYKRIHE